MRLSPLLRTLTIAASCLPFALTSAPAAAATYISNVVASGLNSPRDLAFGPDGALYIVESGFAAASPPPGETLAFMNNGSITRLSGPTQTRIISGLPSVFSSGEGSVTGPQGIAFDASGTGYVVLGLGANPAARPAGSLLGHVLSFTPGGSYTDIADVSAYEAAFNPVGGPLDSNPFHVAIGPDGLLVSDAGANMLYNVTTAGEVSPVAEFPPRFIGPPLPLSDAVPTGVAIGPDGTIYVAQLTGFPFTPGAAQIFSIAPGSSTANVYATGFTNLTDLAFGADGNLYALSFDQDSLLGPNVGGGIFRVSPSGMHENIFSNGLINPTGLTVGSDGAFYVTVNSAGAPGSGAVLRVSAIPEPGAWALMLLGFGALGTVLRARRAPRRIPQQV